MLYVNYVCFHVVLARNNVFCFNVLHIGFTPSHCLIYQLMLILDILDSDENETSPARIAARELYELCMDEGEGCRQETASCAASNALLEATLLSFYENSCCSVPAKTEKMASTEHGYSSSSLRGAD